MLPQKAEKLSSQSVLISKPSRNSTIGPRSSTLSPTKHLGHMKERTSLFYNEPVIFTYSPQDMAISIENIKSFVNNLHNKQNMYVKPYYNYYIEI